MLMHVKQCTCRLFLSVLFIAAAILIRGSFSFGADTSKNNGNYVMSETELQSELMGFADRYGSYIEVDQ